MVWRGNYYKGVKIFMDKVIIKINANNENKTIRELLFGFHLGKEKIYFYEINKFFFVNGNNVNEWFVLKKDDVLEIIVNENIDDAPIPSDLEVVYEDAYLMVVNKPRGILVHGDGNKQTLTLSNMIANHYKKYRIKRKIRICNRLDVETEGLIAVAKDDITEAYINNLLSERKVEKRYYAVVYNRFSKKEGVINLSIGKNLHKNNQMIVYKKGKEAVTEYKVLINNKISLVDVNLITGRTHQIRVHFAHLNHPLLGDNIYGLEDDGHPLMLQSYLIKFDHPFIDKKINVKMEMSKVLKEIVYEK